MLSLICPCSPLVLASRALSFYLFLVNSPWIYAVSRSIRRSLPCLTAEILRHVQHTGRHEDVPKQGGVHSCVHTGKSFISLQLNESLRRVSQSLSMFSLCFFPLLYRLSVLSGELQSRAGDADEPGQVHRVAGEHHQERHNEPGAARAQSGRREENPRWAQRQVSPAGGEGTRLLQSCQGVPGGTTVVQSPL
jgi:hypothetical protein